MSSRLLSKSKYMNGLQCLKYLWLTCNDPDKIPEPDASTQQIFDQGLLVGELAKKLFPGGIDLPHNDFKNNLRLTRESLGKRKPIFEGAFMINGIYSRLDILNPVKGDKWDIIEVKSSTSVKEENIHDVSFQRLCCEMAGITIEKCYLAFINNQYVRHGEINPSQFFTLQDITEEVKEASRGIQDRIERMFKVISAPEYPEVPVGCHCNNPYDCPVTSCWDELPENNIFTLYRGGKKCFDLLNNGILYLKDIPEEIKLNPSQNIQKWCDTNCEPHIETSLIQSFLATLLYPVHYMDFETINPAIPLFDGVRPYQRVPFQFSLHVSNSGSALQHCSFLAKGKEDPRGIFLQRLKDSIGTEGSIVTYNQAFEEGVLKELAEAFPEYTEWVDSIRERLVDLLKPFQSFAYYHPKQNGSASIKRVLPALTGKGYEGMAIADGDTASRSFLNVTYGESTEEERQQVRTNLERYCSLDTEAMIRIVQKLKEVSSLDPG